MSIAPKAVPASAAQQLKASVEARTARVGIIGMGYVGLPLSLLFSEQRFPVTGFDIDHPAICRQPRRFLGLTAQEKSDLVEYLKSL